MAFSDFARPVGAVTPDDDDTPKTGFSAFATPVGGGETAPAPAPQQAFSPALDPAYAPPSPDNELILPEQANAINATNRARAEATPERGLFDDFARGVGTGAVALPGLVVGAGLEAGNLLGADIENTSGQDWIRAKLAPLGLTYAPGEEASTVLGHAGEAAGTFAVPVGGAQSMLMNRVAPAVGKLTARGMQQARRAVTGSEGLGAGGRVLDEIGRNAARAPAAFTATELGAAGAEAAAREAAEDEFGEDSWQAQTAGLLAGAGVGVAPSAARTGASWLYNKAADLGVPVVAVSRNVANNAARRLTGKESPHLRQQAAKRVEKLVPDRERFAEAMSDTESVIPEMLTPAQQSNEPGLMRLGARARADDEQLRAEWAQNAENRMAEARQRIGSLTAEEEQGFVDQYGKTMEDMVTAALGKANDNNAKMGPERDRAEAGEVIARELATARDTARTLEREAWNNPALKGVEVPTSAIQSRYAALKADLPPEMAEDMPAKAFQFLDEASPDNYFQGGRETVPLERLQALRSSLLNEARNAASGVSPNRNRARLASQLAEGLQDDIMNAAPTDSAASEAWNRARNISREFNRVFRQGTVGDVLKTRGDGAPAVEPSMVAQRTIGRGGTSGRVAADHISKALGRDNEAVTGAYRDYLRHEFMDSTNPQAFMKRYGEVLDSQPTLKREFEDAIAAGDVSRVAGQLQDGAASVLGKANPSSEVRRIKQAAQSDPTGAVWSSFRKDMLEELMERSTRPDASGNLQGNILSGNAMEALLDGKKTSGAFREAFTKTELSNLRRIANTMKRVEMDLGANPEAYLTSDKVPIIAELFARLSGANLGERIGQMMGGAMGHNSGAGASLQAASFGSRIMQKLQQSAMGNPTRDIIVRALGDKQKMKDLLTPMRDTPNSKRAMARVHTWVAEMLGESPAVDALEDELEGARVPTLERQPVPSPDYLQRIPGMIRQGQAGGM